MKILGENPRNPRNPGEDPRGRSLGKILGEDPGEDPRERSWGRSSGRSCRRSCGDLGEDLAEDPGEILGKILGYPSIQLLLKPKYLGSGRRGLELKEAYNQGHDVAHFLELRIKVIIYLNQG